MPATTHHVAPNPQVELLDARRQLVGIANRLIQQEHRLYEIQQTLPVSAGQLAMEEESIPYSAAGFMYAELAQIQARGLRQTIRRLLVLSKKTDHELAIEFCGLSPVSDSSGDFGPEVESLSDLDRFRVRVLKTWPDLAETARGSAESEDDDE